MATTTKSLPFIYAAQSFPRRTMPLFTSLKQSVHRRSAQLSPRR